MHPPVTRLIRLGLLTALLVGGTVPGHAQRAYQKWWQKHFDENKDKPVEVIEDTAPERKLEEERYVFPDPLRQIPYTAFTSDPGLGVDGEETELETYSAYSRGAIGLEIGSPAPALKGFEEAVNADPKNPWLKLRLAQAAMMVNDLSRAQALLEEMVQDDPQDFRAMLQLGDLATMRQRYPEARKWFEQALSAKPRNIQALESLCQISYEFYHDLDATKDYSQKILLIDDKNPQAMLWQAEACAFTGDPTRAADFYARLIATRPNLVERVSEVARRLTAMGRPKDARVLYEKAVLASPTNAELRAAWEVAVRLADGQEGLKAAWKKMAEDSNNDRRIYDLYSDFLKRSNLWDELAAVRRSVLEQEPGYVPALMDLAEYHLRRNEFEQAEGYLQTATSQKNAEPSVFRQAGQAYMTNGNIEKAEPLLQRALALDERDVRTLDALSTLAEAKGDRAAAEQYLRDGLKISPADSYLLERLGTFFLRSGDRRQARELFQQVIATKPGDVETWLKLAGLYYEDNDWNGLRILDGEITQRLASSTRFHSAFGELALSWGDFDRARASLERAVLLNPGDLRSRLLLSKTHLQLENDDRAVAVLREAEPTLVSDDLRVVRDLRLGETLSLLHRYTDALAAYDAALKTAPEDFDAIEGRILTLIKLSRTADADRELNDVVRTRTATNPAEVKALQASVLREKGDYARAQSILREAVKATPGDMNLLLLLGGCASDVGDIAEAERCYRELMESAPRDANPWYETAANNLGFLLASKGTRLEEAEKLILDALDLNPRAPHILDSLGVVYMKKGDLSKAREYLERASRYANRDGEILTNLGELYEKLGEKELARRAYDKALLFEPGLQPAKDRRDALADTPATKSSSSR
ncbi:tetratricopeptide repeat protein [bacterium]|nr:tetratricopeptide repeat protein [bacterium]